MTEAQGDGVSRRNFLKVATLTAVAAAATGGGAALLKRGDSPVTITTAPNVPPANTAAPLATTAPVISDIIPAVSASGDDLMARLAAAQTENMQLRAANDQLLRDLAALQTAEQDGRVARDSMTLELDNARNQLGILGGLVALYQQLDDVDMGEMVENGLGAVGEKVGELLGGTLRWPPGWMRASWPWAKSKTRSRCSTTAASGSTRSRPKCRASTAKSSSGCNGR